MFIRKCPNCQKEITYKTKSALNLSIKNNGVCKTCCAKNKLYKIHQEIKDGIRLPLFQGKTHTQETIEKIKKHPNWKPWQKHDNSYGDKNCFYGKNHTVTLLKIWTEKFGIEEANKKLIQLKKKQSNNSSGSNNGMYGKPSPTGSGNGWSGWYKNWYFRSLMELSYMILTIERFNINWQDAEKIKIPYINYKGITRNYFPDFLLNNKYLIEIKPHRLINSIDVLAKKEAAINYCKNNNLIYKIISPNILSIDIIKEKYNNKEIVFIKRYDEKFRMLYY